MTLTLNLGFDRGNARTNVASVARDGGSNKWVEIDDSSMVAEINYARYHQINSGTMVKEDGDENRLIIEYNDAYYVFGEFALQGMNPSTGFADQDRYHGLHTKLSLMAYSYLMARKLYPKYDAPTDLAVNLVMGVPVQAFDVEKIAIKEAFEGEVLRFKIAGRHYSVHILSVRVFMEGAGAAIACGLDKSGLVGVIDPGSFTTNVLFFEGQQSQHDLCRSFPIGVGTAVKRMREKFLTKYHYEMSDQVCEEVLRASVGLENPPDDIYSGDIKVEWSELRDWMLSAIKATGEEIQSSINGIWKDKRKQLKKTLLVGGGSYYFHKMFAATYPRMERPQEAEKYNARGYAAIANAAAERSLKKVG